MTELEKAARMALEFCEFCWRDVTLNDYALERLEQTITALTQALAATEPVKPLFATKVAAQKWAELQEQGHRMQTIWFDGGPGGAGTIDPWGKVTWSKAESATPERNLTPTPDHNGAHVPGAHVPASPADMQVYDKIAAGYWTERKGEPFPGYVNLAGTLRRIQRSTYLSRDDQIALSHAADTLAALPLPTERKGEPVATVRTIRGVTIGYLETRLPDGTPLYTSPQVPEDVQKDAERYRFLAEKCRSTSEHWGGRWSIVIEGPAPKSHDSEDDLDAAIDAARKGE